MSASTLSARATHAALTRHRGANDPKTLDARRDLAVANIEHYVKRTVEAAPPLTGEQRDRLALLLRGGGGPHA